MKIYAIYRVAYEPCEYGWSYETICSYHKTKLGAVKAMAQYKSVIDYDNTYEVTRYYYKIIEVIE